MYERVVVRTNDYSVANEVKRALRGAGIRAFLRGSGDSTWEVRCYKTRYKEAHSIAQKVCSELTVRDEDGLLLSMEGSCIEITNTRKKTRAQYTEALRELQALVSEKVLEGIPLNECPKAASGFKEVIPRSAQCPVVIAVGNDDVKRQIVCEWIGCTVRVHTGIRQGVGK